MKQEATGSPRRGWLIAAAATVLTVAAGVTAGALFGWVGPSRDAPSPTASPTAPPGVDPASAGAREPSVDPPPPAALASRDGAPDPAAEEPAGERAEHEHREHERREHHGRGEHEHAHEGDDDD